MTGDYSSTWKDIHDLSRKEKSTVKVKRRDGKPPRSAKDLLSEWKEYFSSLLNNDNDQTPCEPPSPTAQDLPILVEPPTLEETLKAINQTKKRKRKKRRLKRLLDSIVQLIMGHERHEVEPAAGLKRVKLAKL